MRELRDSREYGAACNTPDAVLWDHVRENARRALPVVQALPPHDRHVAICGGGPSLARLIPELRARKERFGQEVWAINNAAAFLLAHGIVPDALIMMDARESNIAFVKDRPALRYYLASQCHPALFDELAGADVIMYHHAGEGIDAHLPKGPATLIGGPYTTGLVAMCLAHTLGYRSLHLYGYDSSYEGAATHAYRQERSDQESRRLDASFEGATYPTNFVMLKQAERFPEIANAIAAEGGEITVHGTGLLPAMFRAMCRPPEPCETLTAVYDLAVSPPTYDFLAFLSEAEKARIAHGARHLDIMFQPGPNGGFRDDNLPPDLAMREAMLWRVCMGACRLLPSVRDVQLLKHRQSVDGVLFPDGWAPETPVAMYGTRYFKAGAGASILRATEDARATIARAVKVPYVTVTIRQAAYWPERNSQLDVWVSISDRIERLGWRVVWVPDADHPMVPWPNVYLPAMTDIDLRLALYEGAAMNFGVSNGPMTLCYLSDAPYRVFKPVVESCPSATAAFLRAHGMNEGDQYAGNGRLIWAADDYDVVLRTLLDLIHEEKVA